MSKGLDSAKAISAEVAEDLVKKQFSFVCRYYFRSSKFKDVLTKQEAQWLSLGGLWIVTVYENGYPTTPTYFTASRGRTDAVSAIRCAMDAGQPKGTVVYLAVDYDSDPADVLDYFRAVSVVFAANGYSPGCYGNGVTIDKLKALGLINHGWLSMSRSFEGYQAELPHADIAQGSETTIDGLDVDGDTATGHSGAWRL